MTITIEHLGFSYGRMAVLRDISATSLPGRITAVVGPNAAGKSTLLRCGIGALKPAQGRVLIDGKSVARLTPRARAGAIAYVPQRSIVSAAFTVRQVVELGRYALRPSRSRVDDALARLDLREIEQRPYPALSVGQQQRVTMARALAQIEPGGHLVLDEPMSALDLKHVGECAALLREAARAGATVLIAMHDLSLAAGLADDVWMLHAGRLVASGETAQVLTTERLTGIFGVRFQWIADREGEMRLLPDLHHPASSMRD